MGDDDGHNGIANRILDEVLALAPRVVRIEERMESAHAHLRSIDARLELGSSAIHQQGTAVALQAQQIGAHAHKISDLYQRLGATENTGQIHLVEERTRWRTVSVICAALVGLLGVAATVSGLTHCKARAAAPAAVDAARR